MSVDNYSRAVVFNVSGLKYHGVAPSHLLTTRPKSISVIASCGGEAYEVTDWLPQKAHPQINLRAGAVLILLVIVIHTFLNVQDIHAQQFQVLYAFTACGDGANPVAGITVDQAGKIYGTTTLAAANNAGTIFQQRKLSEGQWRLSILHQFQPSDGDGTTPLGRLVFGPEGLLYGTTYSGGANNCGSVYEIGPPANACANATCGWRESVIYSFGCSTTGWKPGYVDPVFDAAGNMYGTGSGGGSGYYGVVFKLAPSNGSWTEIVLYSFDGAMGYSTDEFGRLGQCRQHLRDDEYRFYGSFSVRDSFRTLPFGIELDRNYASHLSGAAE